MCMCDFALISHGQMQYSFQMNGCFFRVLPLHALQLVWQIYRFLVFSANVSGFVIMIE